MGDKDDNLLNGKSQLMVFIPEEDVFKPIGKIVEKSTSIESEEESDCVPTRNSFSFSCEMPSLSKWYEENIDLKPVKEAQAMLNRLRDYQELWHKYYGMGMRRERRKIERNFKTLAQCLAIHCKHYGITFKTKRQ